MRQITEESLPDEIELTVRFKLINSPFKSSGIMHMKISDCIAEVFDGDEKLGSVDGCIGAGVEVVEVIKPINGRTRITYYASAEAIWTAYQAATESNDSEREGGTD